MGFQDLFESFNDKAKIYSKKNARSRYVFGRVSSPYVPEKFPLGRKPVSNEETPMALNVQREADRVVVAKYEQAGIMINDTFEILQFRGDTSDYLKHAPGTPSRNLLKMAR